jgi:hypothetical protein
VGGKVGKGVGGKVGEEKWRGRGGRGAQVGLERGGAERGGVGLGMGEVEGRVMVDWEKGEVGWVEVREEVDQEGAERLLQEALGAGCRAGSNGNLS